MGLGELQLDRGQQIDVVAPSESVAIVRLAMAQGGEVAVGLLEGAALVTRVGGVAAGAIADLQETGIAVMRSRAAGQVVVVEDVEFADVFPGVGVVSGVDTVTPHSREGGGRQVLILDAGLEGIDSDLEAIEGAAQEHPDVAADDRAAAGVARVVHFESAAGHTLAVADEEVVGELLVAESLRAREPPPDGVRRHDAAVILEFEEARAPERGRDLLAVVEGGIVVAVGRMEPPEPDGGRIRELIADLCALEIGAEGAVLAHLEVQLEQGARAAAEPRRQEEIRSEEHTSELQSHHDLVCRLLLEKKKKKPKSVNMKKIQQNKKTKL